MKHRQGRAQGWHPGNNRGERNTDKSTTPPPSFQQLVAEAERFTTWKYTLSGITGTLYMVSSEPITRDEALHGLAQHYGCNRVLTLRPGARPPADGPTAPQPGAGHGGHHGTDVRPSHTRIVGDDADRPGAEVRMVICTDRSGGAA